MFRFHRWSSVSLAAAWVVLWCSAVPAQEPRPEPRAGAPAQEEEPLRRDETITVEGEIEQLPRDAAVATRLDLELERIPFSVGVVTQGILREQASGTLGEALPNVAGVTVQPSSGVHEIFVLRGFDSLNTGLVLTDGAPEPEATYYQLDNVERIEVQKGPAGYLYGGLPVSGVVNPVRKRPERGEGLELGLFGDSLDAVRASADWNTTTGNERAVFRANLLYGESGGWRDRIESDTAGLHPGVRLFLDDSNELHLSVELLANDATPDSGLPVIGSERLLVPRRRSYQSVYDFSDQELRRWRADWVAQPSAHWSVRDKFYRTELDWTTDGTIFNGVAPVPQAGRLLFRTLIGLDNEQSVTGNQLEGIWSKDRHHLLVGFEASRTHDRFDISVAPLSPVPLDFPVPLPLETPGQRPPPIPGFGQGGNAEAEILAPYVLERFSISDRVTLLAGARFDRLDYDDPLAGVARKDEELSPTLGVTVVANDAISVYGSYSQAFAAPSSRVQGERRPLESEQFEAGVKCLLGNGRMRAELALFDLTLDNLAIFDDNGVSAQLGAQHSRGGELTLQGTLIRDLRFHFGYGYTDAELDRFTELIQYSFAPPLFLVVDRSGNRPAFAPEHAVSMWLVKPLPWGLSFGVGTRYTSDQEIDEDNVYTAGSSLVLDAALTYKRENWRFQLNGRNLLDERYDTRGFGATSVIPGAPASAALSVAWSR